MKMPDNGRKLLRNLYCFLHWRTIVGALWRASLEICDWRSHVRRLQGKPTIDVVFISNMRDKTDRKRAIGLLQPKHFCVSRLAINGVLGRTMPLNILPEDLATSDGRRKARQYFISAVEWAQKRGARVVLLAAGTKRLFGTNGAVLKKKFPDLFFTRGDNGTMLLLQGEVLRALELAGLKTGTSRVAVLGAYGLLGEMMTNVLIKNGFEVIGVGSNASYLARIAQETGIKTCQTFEELGQVDAVVACTHSEKTLLTADIINSLLIRKKGKKLLVIDVAEPSNLKKDEWQKCRDVCIRQDAGNAYSKRLKYVQGAISYNMFRLTRGVTFGCFAEALSEFRLAICQKIEVDLFNINEEAMLMVSGLYDENEFVIPTPRNFGKAVQSFNLSLEVEPVFEKKSVLGLAQN